MKAFESLGLRFDGERLEALDQTLLPHEEKWIEVTGPSEMVTLIRRLAVRGAPLIGVAAAISLGRFVERGVGRAEFLAAAKDLRDSRPTAVNLMAAIDRLTRFCADGAFEASEIIREAEGIFAEDVALCNDMADRGAQLIRDGESILTHCNTGGLATVGVGTALGVIRRAHEQGKKLHVYVDETRPLLQGARWTAWELTKLQIPFTLICDNMASFLMARKRVDRVLVGADRIARNGDVANKIGTYGLAVVAHHHHVPFHVVAPKTTLDPLCATGAEIPIEERSADEVRAGRSPGQCEVWNPAFDVTPRELITSIVLDDRLL